jgi:transketolase
MDARYQADTRDPRSWNLQTSAQLSMSAVAGRVLADLADQDPRIMVLTADLKYSNQTVEFERRHPDRFLNTGIAEQFMVSAAAGLAAMGFIPYAATFASFVGLLALEQIRTDLAYPGVQVRLLAHHAGISMGYYGTSHHALEDIGALRSIPGLTIVAPCDAPSLEAMLRATVDAPGPFYIRTSRGRDPQVYADRARIAVGRMTVLRDGADIAVMANGTLVHPSLEAADILAREGIGVAVLDCHTIAPFDEEAVRRWAERTGRVLITEEHYEYGGIASIVADVLVQHRLGGVAVHRAGLPREYAVIGPPHHLYAHYRLDRDGMVGRIRDAVRGREPDLEGGVAR